MLLRFSVSNFGSIRDRQELSMVASKAIKDEPGGLIEAPGLRGEKVLPAAVIYGANASGKSNLVKAFAHMQMLVRDSHRLGEPGKPISLKPFLLDAEYAETPTTFDIDFCIEDIRYAYSFTAIHAQFLEESLHAWRNGMRSMLFERTVNGFSFGRNLKGENRTIEKLTRSNSLFISAAAQNNHEIISNISFYVSNVETIYTRFPEMPFADLDLNKIATDERVMQILSQIDTGIIDIDIFEEQTAAVTALTKVLDSKKLHSVRKINENKKNVDTKINQDRRSSSVLSDKYITQEIKLVHRSSYGIPVHLESGDESAGTIQILSILGPILKALDTGGVVIIDEFGSRLHTRANELILSLFNDKRTNPKAAQLIVTTHDTNLLNAPGLRRDQVWFTEKDEGGATHLYPLTDIETRKGDNLERGYLQGRYGAIPFAGSIDDFVKKP